MTSKIAFIGLGNMGGGMAANQAKAGHVVGAFDLSQAALDRAQAAGCTPVGSVAEAVKDADLVAVLTPDMVQRKLYDEVLKDNLKPGACLLFAHGLNVHFDLIKPREDIDVVLVAPKGPVHLKLLQAALNGLQVDLPTTVREMGKLYVQQIGDLTKVTGEVFDKRRDGDRAVVDAGPARNDNRVPGGAEALCPGVPAGRGHPESVDEDDGLLAHDLLL